MRRWLLKNSKLLRCLPALDRKEKKKTAAAIENGTSVASEDAEAAASDAEDSTVDRDEDDDYDDEDDSEWLASAETNNNRNNSMDSSSVAIQNPINMNARGESTDETVDSPPSSSRSSFTILRGILVGGQHHKPKRSKADGSSSNTPSQRNSTSSASSRSLLQWIIGGHGAGDDRHDTVRSSSTADTSVRYRENPIAARHAAGRHNDRNTVTSNPSEVEDLDNEKFVHFGA